MCIIVICIPVCMFFSRLTRFPFSIHIRFSRVSKPRCSRSSKRYVERNAVRHFPMCVFQRRQMKPGVGRQTKHIRTRTITRTITTTKTTTTSNINKHVLRRTGFVFTHAVMAVCLRLLALPIAMEDLHEPMAVRQCRVRVGLPGCFVISVVYSCA